MSKRKAIIDCDPGVDDSFALFLAKSSEAFDILALTSCFGNNTIDQVTENLNKLKSLFRIDAPVYKGAHKALIKPIAHVVEFHGENGLGNVEIDVPVGEVKSEKAWDAIYRLAKENSPLEIITLGPLTNIAITLAKYEDFAEHVSKIIMMGGSTTFGNEKPHSEANVHSDAHALKMVLDSGIKVVMVGLNATETTRFTSQEIEEVFSNLPNSVFPLVKMLDHYKAIQEKYGDKDLVIHDLAAMAVAVDPTIAHIVPHTLDVEVGDNMMYGRTIIEYRAYLEQEVNSDIVYEINKEAYQNLIKESIEKFVRNYG